MWYTRGDTTHTRDLLCTAVLLKVNMSSWKNLRLKLICAKCNNTFKNPKVLPCLDLICVDCLKDLLSTIAPNPSDCKKDLQCPSCKETISVPLNAEKLVSDVYTERLVEVLSSKPNMKCQICSKDSVPVYAVCTNCRVLLCEACTEAHRRAVKTQEHELYLVSEMRSSAGKTPTVMFEEDKNCPVHPKKLLTFYCRREGELLCEECVSGKHANHDPVKIDDDLVKEERRGLEDVLPDIRQSISELERIKRAVKLERTQGKTKKEENLRKLEDAFQLLQETLNRRKERLQEYICRDADRRDTDLQMQENGLLLLLTQLRKCHSFTENKIQCGVKQDILTMKVPLLERSNQLRVKKDNECSDPVTQEQTSVNFSGIGSVENLLSQTGTFVSPENCVVRNFSSRVPINELNSFRVLLRDARNHEVSNNLERLCIQVQYYNAARHTVIPKTKEKRNGCFEVSYTPSIGGEHTVSISIGGQPIPGSPFNVTVVVRDYTKMKKENCRLFTEYGGKRYERPCGIAIGPNEEVVIVDEINQDGIIFDKNLTRMDTFGQGSGDGKLRNPLGVAVSHNLIAVSEHKNDTVKMFSLQGNYLSKFGSPGANDGQFKYPQGLSFSTKGLLYIVDRDNHRIQVFNERNEFHFKFGSKGSEPGQLTRASDIALNRRDQVFVTDWSAKSCINIYHDNGDFISKIECAAKPLAIGLTPDGCVITSNDDEHCLTVVNTNQQHTMPWVFGEGGKELGQFKYIQGIAVNSSGIIFVTDSGNDRLQVIYP